MTKMRKKLSASVNISELLAMREQGLTNYQIAERLGVTYRTIVSYIGPQPKGLRAPMGSRKGTKPLVAIEPEEVAESADGTSRKTFSEMLHETRVYEAAEKFREEHGIETDGEVETALLEHGDDATAAEPAATPAEIAREMHGRLMAGEVERCQESDVTALIEELRLVFGVDAVASFLACRVWELRSGKASNNAACYISALKDVGGLHV